jgi:hypothetical protein
MCASIGGNGQMLKSSSTTDESTNVATFMVSRDDDPL